MSHLSKEDAEQLKRLAARINALATRVVMPQYVDSAKELDTFIDSLTQPAPELTDSEIDALMDAIPDSDMEDGTPHYTIARAAIAADRAKRGVK